MEAIGIEDIRKKTKEIKARLSLKSRSEQIRGKKAQIQILGQRLLGQRK